MVDIAVHGLELEETKHEESHHGTAEGRDEQAVPPRVMAERHGDGGGHGDQVIA